MRGSGEGLSLLSHALDRVAFVAYFLGAIVPFAALTWVVGVEVLPNQDDPTLAKGMIALVAFMGVLSLGSFLLLRHATRRSLTRLEQDRHRVEKLLDASRAVGSAPYADELMRRAAQFAGDLQSFFRMCIHRVIKEAIRILARPLRCI